VIQKRWMLDIKGNLTHTHTREEHTMGTRGKEGENVSIGATSNGRANARRERGKLYDDDERILIKLFLLQHAAAAAAATQSGGRHCCRWGE